MGGLDFRTFHPRPPYGRSLFFVGEGYL
jgi:hypothetical protein